MRCKEPATASTVPNHTLPHKHKRARNQGRSPSHVPCCVGVERGSDAACGYTAGTVASITETVPSNTNAFNQVRLTVSLAVYAAAIVGFAAATYTVISQLGGSGAKLLYCIL